MHSLSLSTSISISTYVFVYTFHETRNRMRRANLTTQKAYSHVCGRSDDKQGKAFSTNVTSVRIDGVFER